MRKEIFHSHKGKKNNFTFILNDQLASSVMGLIEVMCHLIGCNEDHVSFLARDARNHASES